MKIKPLVIGFVTLASVSCSSPVNSVRNNINLIILDDMEICKAYKIDSYTLPELPNLDEPLTDMEVIDKLVDHIRLLRTDIDNMKSIKCIK